MVPFIGFTGTSTPLPTPQVNGLISVLTRLRKEYLWMNNGDCIYADEIAGKIWQYFAGKVWLRPPDNPKKRAFLDSDECDQPAPYMKRNQTIVDNSSLLVCTPSTMDEVLRSGTWATIRKARKAVIPIIYVYPDGSIVDENNLLLAVDIKSNSV